MVAQEKLVSLSLRSFSAFRRFGSEKARWSRPAPPGRPAVLPTPAPVEPLEGRVLLASQLLPTADTFVRKPEFRDVNFGAAPYLWVKTAAPESGADRVAYLKFDLDDLGNNGVGNA